MAIRKPGKIDVNDILLPDDEPSLLFIQRELARTNGINFEQWWDEFKKGFIGGKRDKNSNFPTSLWTNPKYTNLTPVDSTSGAMTIEYWPDKSIATESYLLSGTVANIITGVITIMLNKSFRPVDFEAWFQGWSEGFVNFKENRTASNYPLGKTAWRAKPENRPRFREWSKPTQRSINGRIIEYWKDRSIQGESIILSGSDADLIRHVLQIEYEGGGASISKTQSRNWPPMKGQPEIKLYFRGEGKAEAKTSFRIMSKTDDPKIPLPLIDKSDLKAIANKIKEQFAMPNLFVWQKGKEVLSYKNRWQGFDGQWWLCRNEAAGLLLLSKILAVSDLTIDVSKIRMSKAVDEVAAFPAKPPDVLVLGQQTPQSVERPLVDVTFWRAEIILSKLSSPIPLVERGIVVYGETK